MTSQRTVEVLFSVSERTTKVWNQLQADMTKTAAAINTSTVRIVPLNRVLTRTSALAKQLADQFQRTSEAIANVNFLTRRLNDNAGKTMKMVRAISTGQRGSFITPSSPYSSMTRPKGGSQPIPAMSWPISNTAASQVSRLKKSLFGNPYFVKLASEILIGYLATKALDFLLSGEITEDVSGQMAKKYKSLSPWKTQMIQFRQAYLRTATNPYVDSPAEKTSLKNLSIRATGVYFGEIKNTLYQLRQRANQVLSRIDQGLGDHHKYSGLQQDHARLALYVHHLSRLYKPLMSPGAPELSQGVMNQESIQLTRQLFDKFWKITRRAIPWMEGPYAYYWSSATSFHKAISNLRRTPSPGLQPTPDLPSYGRLTPRNWRQVAFGSQGGSLAGAIPDRHFGGSPGYFSGHPGRPYGTQLSGQYDLHFLREQNRLYREAAALMTDGPARRNLLVQQGTTLLQKQAEIAKYFISNQVGDQDKQQAYIQAINQGLQEQQKLLRANAHIEDMRLRVVRENFAASYRAQMDELKLKLKDTTFSEGLAIGFRKVGRDMETFAQMGSHIGQLTARTMSTSFETFFFDIMEGRVKRLEDYFKSFFASVGQALMRMAAQQTATFIVSSIGSLFAAEKGGILPGSFVPVSRFQTGGVIRRPTLGLIGEGSRHEAVVPLPDNRHIPVLFTGQEQTVIQQSPPVINFVVNNQTGVPLQVKQAQALTQQGPGLYQQVVNISIHAAAMNPSYRRAHGI